MTEETIWTEELRTNLRKPLEKEYRSQGDFGHGPVEYIKDGHVTEKLNKHFGEENWAFTILSIEYLTNVCVVHGRLDVKGAMPREDVGVGPVQGDTPNARRTAIGAAATFCRKRCAKQFGKQFGSDMDDFPEDYTGPQAQRQPARQPQRQATQQRPYGDVIPPKDEYDDCPNCGKRKKAQYDVCYTCNTGGQNNPAPPPPSIDEAPPQEDRPW